METTQLLAVAVTALHLALLASVYFSSSIYSGAYVSTEIHGSPYFAVCLTLLVLSEAVLGASYVVASDTIHRPTKLAAAAGLALAAAGWITLVSTRESTTEHAAGTAVYVAATSFYSLLFIVHAAALRTLLLCLWTLFSLLALAFASLHFGGFYPEAAAAEWAAFLAYAAALLAFFAANPPSGLQHKGKAAQIVHAPESAVPLLALPRHF